MGGVGEVSVEEPGEEDVLDFGGEEIGDYVEACKKLDGVEHKH